MNATFHLVQTELSWENPAANREAIETLTKPLNDGVIVLPEMFSTGFSMASSRLAERMNGETVTWLQSLASSRQDPVCGSLIVEAQGCFYNRFVWCEADGSMTTYDKRHLFRMAEEHHHYSPGSDQPIIRMKDLTLMPQICYDLRFPVWSRNLGRYDVLLYVANWPAARHSQWLALLKARAIENLCYVIGVNRVGSDGNGVDYQGGTCVVGPDGEYLLKPTSTATVFSVSLDLRALQDFRASFPAHLDADEFILQ